LILNKNIFSEKEYENKLKSFSNYESKVFSFDDYENLRNVEFFTDNQITQGDTFAELSFNTKNNACNIIFFYLMYKYLFLTTFLIKFDFCIKST